MIRPSERISSAVGEPQDRSLERKAVDCLENSPYRILRQVHCRAHNGVLTLSGRVPSFHMKQVAQTIVMNQAHIPRVVNQLEVMMPADTSW